MKNIINEKDIRKASDTERCQILIKIIKGQAKYQKKSEVREWKNKII